MSNILDEQSSDDYSCDETNNALLDDWVAEQKTRFTKILQQLELLNNLPANNLDELGNRLEDIDYHSSSLANIFSLVVGDDLPVETSNLFDSQSNIDLQPNKLKRWPLLQALWFHVMMAIDPDSIYYSPNFGKDAWLSQSSVVNNINISDFEE